MPDPIPPIDAELNAMAWRLARDCRHIVQTCLREEEWPEADREFFAVIRAGLEQWSGMRSRVYPDY